MGFYGGTVYLYPDPDNDIRDSENIEFTFTHVANLIDGNPGQVIVRKMVSHKQAHISIILSCIFLETKN